ncbi:MAG: hypothetical protein NT010_17005 [Proteobacteria bacterium]|nr:hypothetical protein [Pseudomonadota bacterium]
MKRFIAGVLVTLLFGFSTLAHAALHDRGRGLIYDDVLNITWLQDADYAMTTSYATGDGCMMWSYAKEWVDNLVYAGYSGWRLPRTLPLDGVQYSDTGYIYLNGRGDYAFNISAPGTPYAGSTASELAYMFYNNLGNNAFFDIYGYSRAVGDYGLIHTGQFTNFGPDIKNVWYWSESNDSNAVTGWTFYLSIGLQAPGHSGEFYNNGYAWAVHDGDIGAPVPIPGAILLFAPGLAGLAAIRRRFAK